VKQEIKLLAETLGTGILLFSCGNAKAGYPRDAIVKPNIIFILADDLGYGDVGFQGQKRFRTPNIDMLAAQGLVFTNHYSGCTVSAPSRCSLFTGFHTGHTYIRGNREKKPEGQEPIPSSIVTVTEILQAAGYTTGAFGKWGLGSPGSEGDPMNQGFNEFFGYNCQSLAHNYYPYHLWHNREKVMLEENAGQGKGKYAPDLIHEQALKFLENNKGKPFFLYYPSTIPHAELFAPERLMEQFRGKLLPEKSFKGTDNGTTYKQGPYGSQPEAHAAFAAMVTRLDEQVGEIVQKLKELGIAEKTMIIFTSDNGPHLEGGADPDYFDSNGPLKGYKRDLSEGGIRVPFIACWPGKIKPGKTNHVSAFWDFLPTTCELAGLKTPAKTDGISYLPTLTGQSGKQKNHEYLYWEFHEKGTSKAIRMGNWKGIKPGLERPLELYDLSSDMGETTNVAEGHPDIVRKMEALLISARTESSIWPAR
jgi:arylsulfatase A